MTFKTSYCSLLTLAQSVLKSVISDVSISGIFSLIVDEITTSDKVIICVRYVADLEPREAFPSLRESSSTRVWVSE